MLKEARERAKLSQQCLADLVPCDRSTISRAESKNDTTPGVVLRWSEVCKAPELTFWYCKHVCAIGQAYSYELLDSIDSSMPAVVLTGIEELQEGLDALKKFSRLIRNRKYRSELSKNEQQEAEELLQQFAHDISRYTDIVKMSAARMGFDLVAGVKTNDKKALKRGYIKKKSAMQQFAIADS